MPRITLASAHAHEAMHQWAARAYALTLALLNDPHNPTLITQQTKAVRCLKAARTKYRNAQSALGLAKTS